VDESFDRKVLTGRISMPRCLKVRQMSVKVVDEETNDRTNDRTCSLRVKLNKKEEKGKSQKKGDCILVYYGEKEGGKVVMEQL